MNTSGYKPLQISINTYVVILNDRNGADGAFAFISECGFEAIDYNFERLLPPDAIRRGKTDSVYDLPVDELLRLFAPLREAAQNTECQSLKVTGCIP